MDRQQFSCYFLLPSLFAVGGYLVGHPNAASDWGGWFCEKCASLDWQAITVIGLALCGTTRVVFGSTPARVLSGVLLAAAQCTLVLLTLDELVQRHQKTSLSHSALRSTYATACKGIQGGSDPCRDAETVLGHGAMMDTLVSYLFDNGLLFAAALVCELPAIAACIVSSLVALDLTLLFRFTVHKQL